MLSVVVRKGRKMLKQAANRLLAEMAVHTHGCHASPAGRQEGQPPTREKKSLSCPCPDRSPKGTLAPTLLPERFSVSQPHIPALAQLQELQSSPEGGNCPAAHKCIHAGAHLGHKAQTPLRELCLPLGASLCCSVLHRCDTVVDSAVVLFFF